MGRSFGQLPKREHHLLHIEDAFCPSRNNNSVLWPNNEQKLRAALTTADAALQKGLSLRISTPLCGSGTPALCKECQASNDEQRNTRARVDGLTAFVTGGCSDIGIGVVTQLLKLGAKVAVTTRFPLAAADRFAKYSEGLELANLLVYGCDLRQLNSLNELCDDIVKRYSRIDIIVHLATH